MFKMLGLPEIVAEGDPIPISEEMQRKNGLVSDLSRFCSELAFITRYQQYQIAELQNNVFS